jgi:hypothetical protein
LYIAKCEQVNTIQLTAKFQFNKFNTSIHNLRLVSLDFKKHAMKKISIQAGNNEPGGAGDTSDLAALVQI